MGIRTVETRTCEICGAENVIDWSETKDLREARKGWGRMGITAFGHTVDGVSLDPRIPDSKVICPSHECARSAFEDLLETLNARLREEFEKALLQPVE